MVRKRQLLKEGVLAKRDKTLAKLPRRILTTTFVTCLIGNGAAFFFLCTGLLNISLHCTGLNPDL